MDNKKIGERKVVSEEVYDEINSRPPWMIRNGLGSIFLIIVVVAACAALLGYPETLPIAIKLQPSSKPYRLCLPDSITPIAPVSPGRRVTKGDPIATLSALHGAANRPPILAPSSGRLYMGYDYQHLQTVLQIVPDSISYTIWGEIDEPNAAKVAVGMKIRVHLGTVTSSPAYIGGSVMEISAFPVDHKYAIRIVADPGNTNLDRQLMAGDGPFDCQGEIEVSNSSILTRIFLQSFHLKRS
jgi:hypothetical protein